MIIAYDFRERLHTHFESVSRASSLFASSWRQNRSALLICDRLLEGLFQLAIFAMVAIVTLSHTMTTRIGRRGRFGKCGFPDNQRHFE